HCCTVPILSFPFFLFNVPPTTKIYTLSLHALFRSQKSPDAGSAIRRTPPPPYRCLSTGIAARSYSSSRRESYSSTGLRAGTSHRSEEHTSELQSPCNLVCRLLLEKKN